jgi:hypothetical protein
MILCLVEKKKISKGKEAMKNLIMQRKGRSEFHVMVLCSLIFTFSDMVTGSGRCQSGRLLFSTKEIVILYYIDFPGLLQWQNETNVNTVRATITYQMRSLVV